MIQINMPDLGQTTDEVTIISWKKKVGDKICRGDVLVEVETDKAVAEVESYADGILKALLYDEGAKVKAGEAFATLDEI
jgi:pyruvate/2-oxoglutarate dehydrogenase complex dihydrolipoamide acyltransferase (E2) component